MPDYIKDTSPFKKWIPVKAWFAGKPIAIMASSLPVVAACDQINRAVNSGFVYLRDGLNDLWYTPDQFVKAHGGDCEDFSIYKMYRLAQMGVPLSQMELVICTDKQSREYHCVLRVFSGNNQYILDNQNLLLWNKASYNTRYAPIYAIGTSGWRICIN
jgi:predicted transglutaminase-like cysteine proteinase